MTAPGRLRRLAAQSMVTIDQLVFSAITFAVQLVAAPVSTEAEFGLFSLIAIVQTGQWYLGRALSSEPFLVTKSDSARDPHRLHGAAATSLSLGMLIGACCAIMAILLPGPARTLLLIQAVASPLTAVLDHSRYVGYAQGRAKVALLLDVAWLVLFLAGIGVAALTGGLTMTSTYLIWALAVLPVAITAVVLTGSPFAPREIRPWVTVQRGLIPGFLIDAAYLAAGTSATFAVIGGIAGLDGLGLLRKAFLPVTALIVLFVGISTTMLAHLAGRQARDVIRAPAMVSGLAAVATAVCALLALIAPNDLLTAVLGSPWSEIRPLMLILLTYAFLLAAGQAAMAAAKATGRAWLGPQVRTVQFISELALVSSLTAWIGVTGAAIGMAVAWLFAAALAWRGLLRNRV
jgi:O-antigen/teichoic acid export membrane protein